MPKKYVNDIYREKNPVYYREKNKQMTQKWNDIVQTILKNTNWKNRYYVKLYSLQNIIRKKALHTQEKNANNQPLRAH